MSDYSTVQKVGSTVPRGRSGTLASPDSTGHRAESPREEPVGVVRVPSGNPEFGRRILEKEAQLSAAVSIRTADRAMEGKSGVLQQMHVALEEVRKSYPPFPPGSEERVRRLRQYTALRAMIDRLTIPPDESAAPKPHRDPETPATQYTFAVEDGWQVRAVRRDDAGLEPKLPVLVENASDEEIREAYEALTEARRTLDAERETLRMDSQVNMQDSGTAPTTEAEAAATASTTEAGLALTSLPITTGSRTMMSSLFA